MRAVRHDPAITAPRSWWLLSSGYAVAAVYCVVFHVILWWRESKEEGELPTRKHTLMHIPILYWSLFYLVIGLARVYAPK